MNDVKEQQVEPINNWLSVAGRWTFQDTLVRYEGPREGPTQFGIVLSDKYVRDGIVRAKVTFETDKLDRGTAGILLGYEGQGSEYVVVGLGGFKRSYSVIEYAPDSGWRSVRGVASIQDLKPNQAYELEVVQRGQSLVLSVNNVRVFEHVLSRPLPGNQLGLFAFKDIPIRFQDVSVQRTEARLFVAMQFSEPFDTLYREVILPTATALGFQVVRIDEVVGPGIIFQDIQREIAEAKVIVAEISPRDPQKREPCSQNPNVMYELGYAQALNKPTILLARRGCDLPFDIRSYRVVFYDDSIGGKPEVERNLENHLKAILKEL